MEVISIGHVYMEKKVFNPYGWVRGAIVRFYVDGFKPIWELVFHYPICKTDRVGWSSEPSGVVSSFGRESCVILISGAAVPIQPGIIAVVPSWSVFS